MGVLMPGQRVLQLSNISGPASQQFQQKDQTAPEEDSGNAGNGDFIKGTVGRVIARNKPSKSKLKNLLMVKICPWKLGCLQLDQGPLLPLLPLPQLQNLQLRFLLGLFQGLDLEAGNKIEGYYLV